VTEPDLSFRKEILEEEGRWPSLRAPERRGDVKPSPWTGKEEKAVSEEKKEQEKNTPAEIDDSTKIKQNKKPCPDRHGPASSNRPLRRKTLAKLRRPEKKVVVEKTKR